MFAVLLVAVMGVACSRASAPSASSSERSAGGATAAAAPAAEGKSNEKSPKAKADGGGDGEPGPKTWKRAGSATHAARISIGDKEQIPLRGMQFKIDIDGFRARVVLDAYFENDRERQYEGNFQLRLPDEATPYFFAFGETGYVRNASAPIASDKAVFFPKAEQKKMGTAAPQLMEARAKTWQNPKEARMVPKDKAAFAFTETTRAQADPALLEWAGAGVFNAKVFPITPHKVHRIVLAYDVNLVRAGNDFEYRLELPEGATNVAIDVSTSGEAETEPKLAGEVDGGRTFFHADGAPDRAITFRLKNQGNAVIVGSDPKIGPQFAAHVVPGLPATTAASRDQAVFAVDTSLSSNPDRFNVFMKLLAANLENNRGTLKRFGVLFFNVETTWWKAAWTDNTKDNVYALLNEMKNLTLEGATDVGAALSASQSPAWLAEKESQTWDTFLLSDGAATWGESDKNLMAARLRRGPLFAYQTGLAGTDTQALSQFARESGGAVFSVIGEDEIKKASTAHRTRPFRLVSVKATSGEDVVVAGRPRTIYPGQALFLAGRGTPKGVTLTVEQDGKESVLAVKLAAPKESPLAPRAYGQIATSVLEEFGKATEQTSRAYAIHYRVVGETCSLVMLEREEDYRRFDIRPEHEADVVKEQLASVLASSAEAALKDSLADPKLYVLRWLDSLKDKPGMTIALSDEFRLVVNAMPKSSFVVTPKPLVVKSRTLDGVSADLKQRLSTPGKLEYDGITDEALARKTKYGTGDALRALSSLVEQTPGDAILARDVGFSVMELGLPEHAFYLFRRVADSRPWEPQSYRAMADVLARMGMTDLAIVYYEVAIQGSWNPRFGEFHKIAAVDYVRFLRGIQKGERKSSASDFAAKRLATMNDEVGLKGADLIVMVTWNTDNSDVDLHVTEPSGEECFYSNRKTKLGGELTQDVTQGYGPEMYVMKQAKGGNYAVRAKYFTPQRNRASARTKVYAQVIENWGTLSERITEKSVTLAEGKEMHDITTVKR